MPRAEVRLPELLIHRPGSAFALQLANLRGPGAILDPQLGTGPGPVCPGWGLCLLLLGLPQAPGHPRLPPELCLHPHTPVSPGQGAGNCEPGSLRGPGAASDSLAPLQLPHWVAGLWSPHPDPCADSPSHFGVHRQQTKR